MPNNAHRAVGIIEKHGDNGLTAKEAAEATPFSVQSLREWLKEAVDAGLAEREKGRSPPPHGGSRPYVYRTLDEPRPTGEVTDQGCEGCGADATKVSARIEARGNSYGASPHRVLECGSCGNETAQDMTYEPSSEGERFST